MGTFGPLVRAAMRKFGSDRMRTGLVTGTAESMKLTQCMVRPCVARGFRRSVGFAVLHQCIRPLIGALVLRAIMDISAHAVSLAARPQVGHLGHQFSHAPGRPVLHLVSSSRRPRRETGI